jgi:hypothetical protein
MRDGRPTESRHRDKKRAELRAISFASGERLLGISVSDVFPFQVLVNPIGEFARHTPASRSSPAIWRA